jgi:hypothetical protein
VVQINKVNFTPTPPIYVGQQWKAKQCYRIVIIHRLLKMENLTEINNMDILSDVNHNTSTENNSLKENINGELLLCDSTALPSIVDPHILVVWE